MVNEPVYFYSFLYMALLVWASAMSLILFRVFVKRKAPLIGWLIVLAAVALDLFVYAYQVIPSVTQPRDRILFNEHRPSYSFPDRRKERIFFEDVRFRYFRPALYQRYSAFDLANLDYFTLIYGTQMSPSTLISLILDEGFPFQNEAMKLSPLEFIKMGRFGFDAWDTEKRMLYLGFLETVLQDTLLQERFYDIFTGFGELAWKLKSSIRMGQTAALEKGSIWVPKDEAIDGFEQLIDLRFPVKAEWLKEVVDSQGMKAGSPFVQLVRSHVHQFKELTSAEYLIGLWYRYRLQDVNTLVRSKDYDRIANLFEYPVLQPNISRIRRRIREDFGITAPLVRFFNTATVVADGQYYKQLSAGMIDNHDLYIEGVVLGGESLPVPPARTPEGSFSYQVTAYDPNRLRILYATHLPGYLYVSDGYDHYWKARIDGARTRVYKANGAFKAILIPAGSHSVEFIYDPSFFKVSLWLYYFTLCACAAYLIVRGLGAATARPQR